MIQLYGLDYSKLYALTNYKDLKIERTLDGEEVLSFLYPKIDPKYDSIKEEAYIRTKKNEYVVKEVNIDEDWSEFVGKINLEELKGYIVNSFETLEQVCSDAINLALAGTGWTIGSCDVNKKRTVRKANCSSYDILQEIRNIYRCDFKFDAINKKIYVYQSMGNDKGAYFSEQLNLKKLGVQSNSYNFCTRIIPKGKDGLSIRDINGGKEYVENYQYSTKVMTMYWEDNRYTDAQSLFEDAKLKLNELSKPIRAYKAEIFDLANNNDKYKNVLAYDLGDTITLLSKDKKVKDKQRIIKITEYPDEPERNFCDIANKTLSFADIQAENQSVLDSANSVLTSNGGIDGSKVDRINAATQIYNLDSEVARITNLSVISANIQDLYAHKASIDELSATTARVGTLEATTATITQLNTAQANINNLIATKASITDLNASNGRITNLESNTASINNLLAGNLSAANMQAGFITANSGLIANGAIKDAMIDTLSVGKILAGDINTNKFRIVSTSGNMLISDNTIQIKDSARVRIQIGKDASNDYNMYVWDSSGNLMFDATGLKASGIKTKIIRDDMVSDTANINGSKIEKESLVTQINGATTTLKASKIKLDTENQTLDLAFTSLKSTVTSTASTVSSQGTSIYTIQGQISSKIWSTDITNAVNSISVGGRNLIYNTGWNNDTSYWNLNSAWTLDNTKFNGNKVMKISGATTRKDAIPTTTISMKPSTTYTISAWFMATDLTNISLYWELPWWSTTGNYSGALGQYITFSQVNTWVKVVRTFTTPSNLDHMDFRLDCMNNGNGTIYFSSMKLEEGNKSTDWTPAPEDVQGQIDLTNNNISTINTNYSSLNQTVSSISANVSSLQTTTSNLGTRMTSAESSITALNSSIVLKVTQTDIDNSINNSDTMTKLNGLELLSQSFKSGISDGFYKTTSGTITIPPTGTKSFTSNGVTSYVMELDGKTFLNTDYIAVNPHSKIWLSVDFFSTSASTIYIGVEHYDSNKNPLAVNSDTVYQVSGVQASGAWIHKEGFDPVRTNGVCAYIKLRFLTNWGTSESSTVYIGNISLKQLDATTVPQLQNRMTSAESSITQLSSSITLKVNTSDFTSYQSSVTGSLSTKANQTDLNTTNNNVTAVTTRVSTAESSISVLQGQIVTKVSTSDIETLKNNVIKVRYIRDWLNGSTINTGNHWIEIKAMQGTTNLAKNKTAVATSGTINNAAYITDEVVNNISQYTQSISNGLIGIVIDLGVIYDNIDYLQIWHYYGDSRTYHNTKTEVSQDGVNWITVFDSAISGEYKESVNGHIINLNIGNIVNRISTAESSITQLGNSITLKVNTSDFNALTGRVSSTESNISVLQGQISSKVNTGDFGTLITQNSSNVQIAVGKIGNTNLLKNGGFYHGLSGWEVSRWRGSTNWSADVWFSNTDWTLRDGDAQGNNYGSTAMIHVIDSANALCGHGLKQRVRVLPNTTYSLQGLIGNHRSYINLEIWSTDKDFNRITNFAGNYLTGGYSGGTNISGYYQYKGSFTTPNDCYGLEIYIYIERRTGDGTDSYLFLDRWKLEEGNMCTAFQTNGNEVAAVNVIINDSGLTINNGAINIYNSSGDRIMYSDTSGLISSERGLAVYDRGRGGGTQFLGHIIYNMPGGSNDPLYVESDSGVCFKTATIGGQGNQYIEINAAGMALNGSAYGTPNTAYFRATDSNLARITFYNQYRGSNMDIAANGGSFAALSVSGAKNCVIDTENYGTRAISAYETAEYYFGDIGSGKIDQGKCVIVIEDVFRECINTDIEYHVFLQKYGQGDIWVSGRTANYFVIEGTEGLNFSWEIKAKRKGYENHRLEIQDFKEEKQSSEIDEYVDNILDISTYENSIDSILKTIESEVNKYEETY